MRTNKEVIEHLKPYTEMKGQFLNTLVEIIPHKHHLSIRLDFRSAFDYMEKPYTNKEGLRSYLRYNGFKFNWETDSYDRPNINN